MHFKSARCLSSLLLTTCLLTSLLTAQEQTRPVTPANSGDRTAFFLPAWMRVTISTSRVKDHAAQMGSMPAGFGAQFRQALDNVKAVVVSGRVDSGKCRLCARVPDRHGLVPGDESNIRQVLRQRSSCPSGPRGLRASGFIGGKSTRLLSAIWREESLFTRQVFQRTRPHRRESLLMTVSSSPAWRGSIPQPAKSPTIPVRKSISRSTG